MRTGLARGAPRWNVVVAAVATVIAGMAFSLGWGPVVLHASGWVVPTDIWGTFRDAHIVGWGGEGILYSSNTASLTGFISLPALPILLAPVAILSGALHLSESLPFLLQRPTAWLLLGPVEMAVGASLLFPLDGLARRLGVPDRTRAVAVWLEAALIWPVVAMWGHPEDLAALGLAVYSLMSAFDGRWRRASALLGIGLAFQPLVIVLVPLVVAVLPWRRWATCAVLLVAPAALLLVAPLFHAWHTTLHYLVDQPTFPTADHATPWVALAHVLKAPHPAHYAALRASSGGLAVRATNAHTGTIVAGGPVRLIPIGLSSMLGVVVFRRRPSERTVWWFVAVALSLRCLFEAVMVPYYTVPALAIALIVAARLSRVQLLLASILGAACTYVSYRHTGAWWYYVPTSLTLLATVVAAYPRNRVAPVELRSGGETVSLQGELDREPVLI